MKRLLASGPVLAVLAALAAIAACFPLLHTDVAAPPAPTSIDSARISIADRIGRDVAVLADDSTLVLRFDPPRAYAFWRAEVERCSGVARDGWPTFYIAQTVTLTDSSWAAMFVVPSRRIVFGLGNEAVAWIIRHELLHDLLARSEHVPEYFEERCRSLVNPPRSAR